MAARRRAQLKSARDRGDDCTNLGARRGAIHFASRMGSAQA
jgi:hypothetical protein